MRQQGRSKEAIERRKVWARGYNIARRNALMAQGLCARGCGRPLKPGCTLCWECLEHHATTKKAREGKIAAEMEHLRPAMIALYGDPVAIWRDNKEPKYVPSAQTCDILAHRRTVDEWHREA